MRRSITGKLIFLLFPSFRCYISISAVHQSIQNRYVVNVESSFTDEENQLFYIFMEVSLLTGP
jgi:hypothetical protein